MASRENQGLQIALILFVILSIGLGVTTFLFSRDFQEEQVKAAADKKARDEAAVTEAAAKQEAVAIKSVIGIAPDAPSEAAKTQAAKDWAECGATPVADDKKSYHDMVTVWGNAIKEHDKAIKQLADSNKQEKDAYARGLADAKTELDKYKAAIDAAVKQADDNKKANDAEIVALRGVVTSVAKTQTDKASEFDKAVKSAKDKAEDLENKLKLVTLQYDKVHETLKNIEQPTFSVPQGKITYINSRENSVYINLGRDDRLRRGITFSVYPPSENHVARSKEDAKGRIEVIEVTEAHSAIARVTESSTSNPLLPGDVLFTPVWSPGQQQHFALAGFIDIDGNGQSGRAKVRDLINLNGGVVDADMDEKGKITGAMTVNTRYLIRGDRPTDKSDPAVISAYTEMLNTAETLKIETISVQKFINLLGYVPQHSAVDVKSGPSLKKPAKPGDKSGAKADDAAKKDTTFKARKPPAEKKAEEPAAP